MKKFSATLSLIVCVILIALSTAACEKKQQEAAPSLEECAIIHEPEFGGVYITKTIEEFNELGFEYGDSVNVSFSNGYKLEDIPYYNGYYVPNGQPLLIAYPGYDYIKTAFNNGDDMWVVAGLSETDVAEITLAEHGKYLDIQNARDIHYEDERAKFPSDEAFANFRAVKAGNIKENTLYRSASPCDNQHNRAPYVDKLMEEAGVNCILNLADTEETIQGYIAAEGFDSPYFLSIYEAGRVELFTLNMNYSSQDFKEKVAKGLRGVAENEGPYLVHCTEGKDRTGFVCMLLEALCGASYQEIVDDYMITYDNYYEINPQKDKTRYDTIIENVLVPMVKAVAGSDDIDITKDDLSVCAREYLISAGMSESEIETIKEKLSK